ELRFSQNVFALLHFPKSCLKCSSRGECLAQFVTSHNSNKTKTRESAAQQLQIACCRISKTVCLSQPREEIVQIPAHQFETEHLVACYLCVHDSADICGVISSPINPELRGIAGFGLWQKKLFRHACSAGVAQPVGEQIAPRTRDRSNNSLAFISPRPLKRLICTPRRPISKIFCKISGIENSGCEIDFSPSPSINSKIGRSLAA